MSSSAALPFILTAVHPAATTFKAAVPTPANPNGTLTATTVPTPSAFPTWWTGIGGPALIIVFTAVGLLGIGVALLLVLRAVRVRRLDGFYDDSDDVFGSLTVSRRLRKKRLGEKPRIYDLPIAYYKGGVEGRENVAKWGGIVPISVAFTQDAPAAEYSEKRASMISRTSTASSLTDGACAPPDALPHGIGAFNWRCLRPAPQLQDAGAPVPEATLPTLPPPETVPERMQVAVAIAMPRPTTTPSAPPGLSRPEPMPDLCLGFTQVKGPEGDEWREKL